MGPTTGEVLRLNVVLEKLQEPKVSEKKKQEHLSDLKAIFDGSHKALNLEKLSDASYHKIYEIVFKVVIDAKQKYASKKPQGAEKILSACADIIRVVSRTGSHTLKWKTAKAVIDHIIQTIPERNGSGCYLDPLAHHYLQTLSIILENKAISERLKVDIWSDLIDFCLKGIIRYTGSSDEESSELSQSFSGHRSGHVSDSGARSAGVGGRHVLGIEVSRQNAEDLLRCLVSLVSIPHAPLFEKFEVISNAIMRLLQCLGSNVSQLHQLALPIMNAVLSFTRMDRTSFTQSIARELVPIICRFWQGKAVAKKDEMLNSLRDEMLILFFNVHLHLESSVMDGASSDLSSDLASLLEILKLEYSRRNVKDQLQLDDLQMSDLSPETADTGPFRLNICWLRPHIGRERNWANLLMIGILERLLRIGEQNKEATEDVDQINAHDEPPRKRQRVVQDSDRLLGPLKSNEYKVRLTGLQILPFVLQQTQLSVAQIQELVHVLSSCATDKNLIISSWAFLALASCNHQKAIFDATIDWVPLWHTGARSVTFPGTCRAAAVHLHSMLARGLIQYHDIGEDVNAIIAAADISGPVLLCDSAMFLMMHLLHVNITEAPGASLVACQHVIRWLFARWHPGDKSSALHHAVHIRPCDFVAVLRTSLGLLRLPSSNINVTAWSSVAQAWQQHLQTQGVIRYLLLLEDVPMTTTFSCSSCPQHASPDSVSSLLDNSHFYSTRKLILEFLLPKCTGVLQNWAEYTVDRSSQVPSDFYRTAIFTCIIISLLLPHFVDGKLPQAHTLEQQVENLEESFFKYLGEADVMFNEVLIDTLLQCIQPYLPPCGSVYFIRLSEQNPQLLKLLVLISEELDRRRQFLASLSSSDNDDLMDLDDDFSTRRSQSQIEVQGVSIPRYELALSMSTRSFYLVISGRLSLLAAMSQKPESSTKVPSSFVEQLLSFTDEDVLSCRRLLQDIMRSDLVFDSSDAARLLKHVGLIFSTVEFKLSEVAMLVCIDVLVGFAPLWSNPDSSELSDAAKQLYEWFIAMIDKDITSPGVQKGISNLLLVLLRINEDYGKGSNVASPRTSLLALLSKGNASVKFFIGNQLSDIFDLFTLKVHDEIFVDVLEVLPSDPNWMEGIAFRLYVLSRLASRWSTLLRRCIYHIFEIPPKIPDCTKHATRCLSEVSATLKVKDSRELFSLFAPQILYTWLEVDTVDEIPFQIFGFPSLRSLLESVCDEATAILIMRGHDENVERLADLLETSENELLLKSFPKVVAYAIGSSIVPSNSSSSNSKILLGLKTRLGKETYFDLLNLHFVDILAVFFKTTDHQYDVKKMFSQDEELTYATAIMKDIQFLSASDVVLPPNQQPSFKTVFLPLQINHLSKLTQHETKDLYTPTLVTFIARNLFDSIHPALGSLYACSILRKLRILISLSGDTAIQGYPLEMILHSVRPFIKDPECADDAIGIAQYLLRSGHTYLLETPSFVAGNLLAILGSLKIFLQSTQASTTQDSQHNLTMSKAEQFHSWIGKYASKYNSSKLKDNLSSDFQLIIRSAHSIRSVGNAEIGTVESTFLSQLLADEKASGKLLTGPSRKLALATLCSEFKCPTSFRGDIFGADNLAVANAAVVWKSCKDDSISEQYLSWAARILGRAFAASGHIHQELLQESSLSSMDEFENSSTGIISSRPSIISLVAALTLGNDRRTVGLAETALRNIVTACDESLLEACQESLPSPLFVASTWYPYQSPSSEKVPSMEAVADPFSIDAILQPFWLRDLSITLARLVPQDPVMQTLTPILQNVPEFASKAFPFILHLVLSIESQGKILAKKRISNAFMTWFASSQTANKNNLKILLNSILYLRTQQLPGERSIADRLQWLDIDFLKAATAATHCGMFKTALLFVEEFYSAPIKSSRRSSIRDNNEIPELPSEILLAIFQNIDDPDSYYGVQQAASMSTILARLEYEKDGPKALSFRGAQYDSHLRRQNPASAQDAQSLVKALDTLSLSGLSHSLLQAQQGIGMNGTSIDSMFQTARKLEQWDIPVPSTSDNHSVTIYKAFQAVHIATDREKVSRAINDALKSTMTSLVKEDLSASALHSSLQTLAALAEMDEVFSTQGSEQFEVLLSRFQTRFDDINQILSCRGTTLSALSQQPRLQKILNLESNDTRLVEVRIALLSSSINRAHGALQESLSVATSLLDLVGPCRDLGLSIEAAVHMEAADALWDQGEMTSSIGMLQAIDRSSSKNQTIPIGRSRLLSKIGHQVSVARLEKPDRIIEKYLKPALKDLRGRSEGSDAGQVYHQFAVFCDQQLQDPDGLEDLERLKNLSEMKANEVTDLENLLRHSKGDERSRYNGYLKKAKTWLKLDEQELQRHCASRDEFLRQCLENYLLALSASDEHDSNALRFTALWLKHSGEPFANEAVANHMQRVPSRKFATLMNQLSSRLLDQGVKFQELLFALVLRICTEHPYHGMYSIYAGTNNRPNANDDVAVSRTQATSNVARRLTNDAKAGPIWQAISYMNKYYCNLAGEKDDQKYKAGKKIRLKDSPAGSRLVALVLSEKNQIPPPTMQIDLMANCDYTKVPRMCEFEPLMSIASGVSAPKIITAKATNGVEYKQLVKGGNDDLRQDAIMEQVFAQVSELLRADRLSRQRNLSIRTYKVLPLTAVAGVIEFVPNTTPLHDYLMPAHERFYPKDLKGSQCRKEINDVSQQSPDARIKKYRSVTDRFHPVMRYFFIEHFNDPDEWFVKRLAYTRSTAAISILGHVLGLGDRHGHNILLDTKSGEAVHIDLGIAFEMGRVLPVPELVPFRLTRDIIDGMGITKTEGVFRRCCEFTLEAMRKEVYSIMTILDVLRYDPLYSWSISPVRLAKLQDAQSMAPEAAPRVGREKTKENVNQPNEADRALTVVNKKLSKTLSVTATVNDLINQAVDEKNLAVLYSGWAAYA